MFLFINNEAADRLKYISNIDANAVYSSILIIHISYFEPDHCLDGLTFHSNARDRIENSIIGVFVLGL